MCVKNARNDAHPRVELPELAALHFGIRKFRTSAVDNRAGWPINQRFPRLDPFDCAQP